MSAKKSRPEKSSPAKATAPARKVEEIDFHDYVRNKIARRYMEEIRIADHLKKKQSAEAP